MTRQARKDSLGRTRFTDATTSYVGAALRLPWQKRRDEHVDPSRPHEYRSKSDSGIAALAPIGGGVDRQIADIASANAYMRTIGCAVPGCGKPPEDLIHAPED